MNQCLPNNDNKENNDLPKHILRLRRPPPNKKKKNPAT